MIRIALILIIIFSFNSCRKEVNKSTQTHDLVEFNHVILNNPFTIILHESEEFKIEITTAEDRHDFIEFTVNDSILEISNSKKFVWLTPRKNEVVIHIYSEPLSLVEAEETCDISTANPITTNEFGIILKSKVNEATLDLNCGTFYYWNNSPAGGKLTLSGECEISKFWNHALMSIDAKNLTTNYSFVENHSQGIIEVSPIETLEYGIFDIGDIHLYSSPDEIILIDDTSTGELIQF